MGERYKVVINYEEQYSIWPDMRPLSPRDRLRKLTEMQQGIERDARRR